MAPRDNVNDGYEPTLAVFKNRVENLSYMAGIGWEAAGGMDDDKAERAVEEAESDLQRLYRQCVGLVELWPHREREFVSQAYGLLVDQIKTILTWHDRAMVHADEEDEW